MKRNMVVLKLILIFSMFIVCSNSEESTTQTSASGPPEISSRFFELGGIINQLFPGFDQGNQGIPGRNPLRMDFQGNSQYYPNAPIQGQGPQLLPGQGGTWPVIDDASQYLNTRPGSLPYPGQTNPGSYPQVRNPTYPNQAGFGSTFPGSYGGGLNPQVPPQDGFERPTSPFFPQYPGQGNVMNQYPSQGSFMNQNPSQGSFINTNPSQGNFMNTNPSQGDFMNQDPSQGNFMNQNPSQGNFMNQNPSQGNFMNQNPSQGDFMNTNPSQGDFMNQDPSQGNFMNQNPSQGNFMNQNPSQGNLMNQNPSQGNFINQNPSQGNLMNQNPNQGAGGQIPFPQYPNEGEWNQDNFMRPGTGGDGTLDEITPPQGDNLWNTDLPNSFGPIDDMNSTPALPDDQFPPGSFEGGLNGGVGRDVIVPSTTPEPGRIFYPSSTDNPSLKQCVQDCRTSTEYNPVCGSDDVTYINPGKFVCARNCGVNVFVVRNGSCLQP